GGRLGMPGMALTRPFAYAASRTFATRFLHSLLRGVSRDRLDLLGEEYFHYVLKPQLRKEAVNNVVAAVRQGEHVVLVGQLLENILRPLAHHLGVDAFLANRLESGAGKARGGLLAPVGRPGGPLGWLKGGSVDGKIRRKKLLSHPGWPQKQELLETAIQPPTELPVSHAKGPRGRTTGSS